MIAKRSYETKEAKATAMRYVGIIDPPVEHDPSRSPQQVTHRLFVGGRPYRSTVGATSFNAALIVLSTRCADEFEPDIHDVQINHGGFWMPIEDWRFATHCARLAA
jgi:hypothetical protein